jgi:hypothetical protein
MINDPSATHVETGNFVVMDNGTRFYLHVIGIFQASQIENQATDELNTMTIQ